MHKLYGDKQEVTSLARSPTNCHLAVGYRDGYVRIFDITSQDTECSVVFHGHRRAITALAYEHNGMRLASGSQVLKENFHHNVELIISSCISLDTVLFFMSFCFFLVFKFQKCYIQWY